MKRRLRKAMEKMKKVEIFGKRGTRVVGETREETPEDQCLVLAVTRLDIFFRGIKGIFLNDKTPGDSIDIENPL